MSQTQTQILDQRLAGEWAFAPVHSSASFSVKYLVATFSGRFERLEAELAGGRLSGGVEVDSITVKDENLAAHLLSPEFFDAANHPRIEFASRELRLEGEEVVLEGDLTIKGHTAPVRATGSVSGPTEDFLGNTRLGFVLETTIDRTAYGVDWNAELPKGGKALSDEVTLTVELEFHRVVGD